MFISKGVKLENGDILRLGKKLFKIVRIELESQESKKKFLKKAKRKSEFGKEKEKVQANKMANSETTRVKERTLPQFQKEITEEEETPEMTYPTEQVREKILDSMESSQHNTTNINNTEGDLPPAPTTAMQPKKKKPETHPEATSKDHDLQKIGGKVNKTEGGDHQPKRRQKLIEKKNSQSYSLSGSEIDLSGVFNAEHNEFIKVMVKPPL